jgi:guanosine-3',5'-bis(diphosphate) 3'-pyrophosphohydrolase
MNTSKAQQLAKTIYKNKYRLNGEDWDTFINKLYKKLERYDFDETTKTAAFLIDLPKFNYDISLLKEEFNDEIYSIVKNFNKLRKVSNDYSAQENNKNQIEYLRRLIMAVAEDPRVIVLRLIYKLENLKSIEVLSEKQQKKALNKVLDFYVPIADIMQLSDLKEDLADQAFKKLYPSKCQEYQSIINNHTLAEAQSIKAFVTKIEEYLKKHKIDTSEISYRKKQGHSLHKKIIRYKKKFNLGTNEAINKIGDKIAIRIITTSVENCYKALDVLHSNHDFFEEEFDDYINNPKPNGYRSLQTTLKLNEVDRLEIQIRTVEMHRYNEFGPSSHVLYKLYGVQKEYTKEKIKLINKLVDWKSEKTSKVNLSKYEKELFVFTPQGDLITLPKNSTVLDFAFEIHSEIGIKAIRALVDNKLVPLTSKLKNGNVVKIQIGKNKTTANKEWLKVVKTKKAKNGIRKNLRKNRNLL